MAAVSRVSTRRVAAIERDYAARTREHDRCQHRLTASALPPPSDVHWSTVLTQHVRLCNFGCVTFVFCQILDKGKEETLHSYPTQFFSVWQTQNATRHLDQLEEGASTRSITCRSVCGCHLATVSM